MSDEKNASPDGDGEPKKKGKMGLVVWVLVAVIGLGAGFATPMFLMGGAEEDPDDLQAMKKKEPVKEVVKLDIPDPTDEIDFVQFDERVLSLNDPHASKFLKISFSLQVSKSQKPDIEKLVEEKKDILTNWLIGHAADKKFEDVRGKQGYNRFRREIHDTFNRILFEDKVERVQDVLFKEFNVQ